MSELTVLAKKLYHLVKDDNNFDTEEMVYTVPGLEPFSDSRYDITISFNRDLTIDNISTDYQLYENTKENNEYISKSIENIIKLL